MTYSGAMPARPVAGEVTQSVLDFHNQVPPQVAAKLYRELGEPSNVMLNILRMTSRKIYVPHYKYSAEGEGRITGSITVNGTVTQNSVDTVLVVTIASGDHVNGQTYPVIGDIITDTAAKGYAQYRVVAKSVAAPTANTITIAPEDVGTAIGTITAGDILTVTSRSKGNKTGHSQSRNNFPVMRDFYCQQLDETVEMGGRAMIVPTYSHPEGTFDYEFAKAQIRLERNMGGALLMGDITTATNTAVLAGEAAQWGTTDGIGEIPSTTRGLYKWGVKIGSSVTVAASAEALTDFRAIKEYYLTQGINPATVLSLGGFRRIDNYSRLILAANANGGADYITKLVQGNPATGGKDGYVAYFDFQGFKQGSTVFNLAELAELTDPTMFGTTGHGGTNLMISIPLTTIQSARNADVSYPNFAIMYLANAGYSRELEDITIAGAGGGVYQTTIDKKIRTIRTDFGLFCMGGNQIRLTPA
jgi:hypothetical protein